jgi:Arc/MetJ family transcription regulator
VKRTNIELDEKLIKQGMKATGIKTFKGLVEYALEELLRREKQVGMLRFQGKVAWHGNLSAMRTGR